MKSNWIEKLPQHTPPDDSWKHISDNLSFEDFLNEKKRQLPQHQPEDTTWSKIENRLPNFSEKRFRINTKWLAAASILLFISTLWLLKIPKEDTKVSYSSESKTVKPVKSGDSNINEINRRCNEIKVLCKRPEIKELREEIENLDKENAAIEEQMELFGSDADLLAAQQRIQLKKAELAKEIIELMNNHATHS